jgi:hypothetical protein
MISSTPPVQQAPSAFKPSFDILSSLNSSRPASQSPTLASAVMRPQSTTATPPPADPFASLMSASPRHGSPFPSGVSGQQPASAGSSLLDLAGTSASQSPVSTTKAADEDEWDFASSLPESNTLPTTNRVQVLNSTLRVEFVARRHPQQTRQIHIVALFSNGTNQPLSELHFQVAVEKVSYFRQSRLEG